MTKYSHGQMKDIRLVYSEGQVQNVSLSWWYYTDIDVMHLIICLYNAINKSICLNTYFYFCNF